MTAEHIQRPIEETHADVEPAIMAAAVTFQRRYGGDLEEIKSEAAFHYLKAYNGHVPEKGNFGPRIRFVVWNGLLDTKRTQASRHAKLPRDWSAEMDRFQDKVRFDVDRFVSELSEDSAKVVQLALQAHRRNLSYTRSLLTDILTDLGWAAERIAECFGEIKDALR